MIIDKSNYDEKLDKKLLPKRFFLATSFLCIINTEEDSGLVCYIKDGLAKPFELKEEIKIKKLKIKNPTFKDLTIALDKHFDNDKRLIKKTKTAFYDEFNTSCDVKHLKNIYELNLIDNEVVFTKRIVCICTDVENIERSFVSDSVCRVIPFEQINKSNDIKYEDWLFYLLNNLN